MRITGIAGAGSVQGALAIARFINAKQSYFMCGREAVVIKCDREAVNSPSGSRI